MVSIICDAFDKVVDIASEKENLSRGYNYLGHKEYLDLPDMDVGIGDTFDGQVVTKNQGAVKDQAIRQLKLKIVDLRVRLDAATAEGFDDIAAEIGKEIGQCEKDLEILSS